MHQTLFTIGNVEISSYTVLLDLGLIVGLVLTYFEGKRQLGSGETALDLGLWTLIGSIVSGRIGYVLFNWTTFSPSWARVFRIWEYPGLSFYGALFGGLLVLIIFALFQRRSKQPFSFWELADVLIPGLALGLVFGWAACLLFGATYGAPGQGFGYLQLPDDSRPQEWTMRFGTQIAGLAQSGFLFVLYWLLRNRWPFSGAAFLSFGLFYFGGQFFIESTRGDKYVPVGPFRLAQVVALALALVCAVSLGVLWWRARRQGYEVEEAVKEGGEIEGPEGAEIAEDTEGVEEFEGVEGIPEAGETIASEGNEEAATDSAEETEESIEDDL